MVPVLKKLKVVTLLNLLPLLFYGASFDQFMTIKTFSDRPTYHVYIGIHICMKILRSIFGLLQSILDHHHLVVVD